MRVIAGTQRGRRLKVPRNRTIRPTSERVREALFSILQHRLVGATMLDLFAGTGAMGIEALSRGAEHAVFVEEDPVSRQTIEHNLGLCSLDDRATIIPRHASLYLAQGHITDRTTHFDIVFIDPPYQFSGLHPLLEQLSDFSKISPTSCIIVEHFSKTILPDHIRQLAQYRQSRYGDTMLTFYQRG